MTFVLCTVLMILALTFIVVGIRSLKWQVLLFSVVSALILFRVAHHILCPALFKDFVAIAPLGIYYRMAEREINEIKWSEVLGIQKDDDERCAIIELRESQISHSVPCVFQNRSARDAFVALANERCLENHGNPCGNKV